jgi:hypothetical protein
MISILYNYSILLSILTIGIHYAFRDKNIPIETENIIGAILAPFIPALNTYIVIAGIVELIKYIKLKIK